MEENPFQAPVIDTKPKGWRYIPLKVLTTLATIGLVGVSVLLVLTTTVSTVLAQLTAQQQSSEFENLLLIIALGSVGIFALNYIFNVVVICMFMYRANANVRALGAIGLEHTPGWCGGYWFIPIIHLFMPYKCMSEIHKASQAPQGRDWKIKTPHHLMGTWWALWIIGSILDRVVSRLDSFDATEYAWVFEWSVTLIFVAAAMTLIPILRSISTLQEDHAGTTGLQ